MPNTDIHCLKGKEILPYLSELARLRIEIFKEYPYLYEGDLAYEEQYLHTYAVCSVIFFLFRIYRQTIF